MDYIDENLDNVPRQVVPADFSFLSLVDRSIVRAMSGLIKSLTGLDSETTPILLGFATVQMTSPYRYKATILYQEEIMELNVTGSDNEAAGVDSWGTFLKKTKVQVAEEFVTPSPVYNEGLELNIYVHKKRYLRGDYSLVVGEYFTLSEIAHLPQIVTDNDQVTLYHSGNVGKLEGIE